MNWNNLELSLERLKKINNFDVHQSYLRKNSIELALREYLRRLQLWANYVAYRKEDWCARPIFDIQNPYSDHDNKLLLGVYRQIQEYLNQHKIIQPFGLSGTASLLFYSHWELNRGYLEYPDDLPNPYEPFIVMLERGGGGIQMTQLRILEAGGGVKIRSIWDSFETLPPFDISPTHLDMIDSLSSDTP